WPASPTAPTSATCSGRAHAWTDPKSAPREQEARNAAQSDNRSDHDALAERRRGGHLRGEAEVVQVLHGDGQGLSARRRRKHADGRWRPREGRPAPGQLTEFQARRRVVAFIEAEEASRAEARTLAAEAADREAAAGGPTFRSLAHAWLEHLELVQRAKPSTLRD